MTFGQITSICKQETRHIFDVNSIDKSIPYVDVPIMNIEFYGIPSNICEEGIDYTDLNDDDYVYIGNICGYFVTCWRIRSVNKFIVCRDQVEDYFLENTQSTLMEDNGPLNYNDNLFHIKEINVDSDYIDVIIKKLPDIVFAHRHVMPDIISYCPDPIPHEDILKQIERDIAQIAFSESIKNLRDSSYIPTLTFTIEQENILSNKRNYGDTYNKRYIDINSWIPFLNNGYKEWKNTRTLYKIIRKGDSDANI